MRVPRELLRMNITLRDFLGSGARGPVYGEPRYIRAQIEPTARVWVERDNTGTSQDIDALCIIRPEDGPVEVESIVEYGGTRYRVVRSYAMPDERRPYQRELALKRYANAREGAESASGDAS